MRTKIISLIVLTFVSVSSIHVSAEQKKQSKSLETTQEIATIIKHLEFYLTLSEKKFLRNVSMDTSVTNSQRTLAKALVNFEHKPRYSDLSKLEVILNDDKATESEQQLAYIIHRLKFRPREADMAILNKILD